MAYVNAACAGRVTIFSTGGKLHTLTLAARSYALLTCVSREPIYCCKLRGSIRGRGFLHYQIILIQSALP